MKVIMVTPDSEIKEITYEEMKEIIGTTIYSGASLSASEFWQYKKFKLSMLMKDLYLKDDATTRLATKLYNKLKFQNNEEDNDVILGTIFLCNESDKGITDFTYEDFMYVLHCVQ